MRTLRVKLYWLNGDSEEVQGTDFDDAFEKAGYSDRIDELDRWEYLTEIPLIEKGLCLTSKSGPSLISNPEFIRKIRRHPDLRVGSRISIKHARKRFVFRVSRISETAIFFSEECPDNIKRIK